MTEKARVDLDQLLAEEEQLALDSLGLADGVAIGQVLLAHAIKQSKPVAIEIRRVGRVVFRVALPGTTPDNDGWIAGKAAVVERFGHSSWYVKNKFLADGTTFEAKTGLGRPAYAAAGGGYPLSVRGTGVVGIALVSGLPEEEDHALIVGALRAYLAGERA